VIQSDEIFDCENGSRRVGGWTINDHHPYGLLSVPEVIQFSSNIGISKIADRLGAERFARYVAAFGFGRKTGIDLPGEVPGLVRRGRWAAIDVATGSFGQGIATTPIQLAAAFGAIATGGRLHQPFVVSRAVDSKGRTLFDWDTAEQQAAASQPINEATARSVTAMLERVVAEKRGTGTRARIDGVRVAGKTGTAQKVDPNTGRYSRERLASFIGFAPADAPAVVTVVMIDNPRKATYGGIVAAPVFSEITERALDQLGRRPPPIAVESEPAPALVELAAPSEAMGTQDGVPSFVGMSLRLALDKARAEGLDVDVRGSGWVVAQEPPAGSPREGRKILLLLESRA
jgi:cell division protein FtsI (penicillin-binding protein 3)